MCMNVFTELVKIKNIESFNRNTYNLFEIYNIVKLCYFESIILIMIIIYIICNHEFYFGLCFYFWRSKYVFDIKKKTSKWLIHFNIIFVFI